MGPLLGREIELRHPVLGSYVAIVVTLAGCATISAGTKQKVSFDANVRGADVYVDGQLIGKTPLVEEIPRSSKAVVEIRKDGYTTLTQNLDSRVDGWFWGNICSGGTLGSSTDAGTGAMWKYDADKIYANLRPTKAGATAIAPRNAKAKAPTEVRASLNVGRTSTKMGLRVQLLGQPAQHPDRVSVLLPEQDALAATCAEIDVDVDGATTGLPIAARSGASPQRYLDLQLSVLRRLGSSSRAAINACGMGVQLTSQDRDSVREFVERFERTLRQVAAEPLPAPSTDQPSERTPEPTPAPTEQRGETGGLRVPTVDRSLAAIRADDAERWRNESRLRFFVLMQYESLSIDVARGYGEHFRALRELLGAGEAHDAELIAKLRAARRQSRGAISFSNRVVALRYSAARD